MECEDTKGSDNEKLANDAVETTIEQPNFNGSSDTPIDRNDSSQQKNGSSVEESKPKLSLFAYVAITSKTKKKK